MRKEEVTDESEVCERHGEGMTLDSKGEEWQAFPPFSVSLLSVMPLVSFIASTSVIY